MLPHMAQAHRDDALRPRAQPQRTFETAVDAFARVPTCAPCHRKEHSSPEHLDLVVESTTHCPDMRQPQTAVDVRSSPTMTPRPAAAHNYIMEATAGPKAQQQSAPKFATSLNCRPTKYRDKAHPTQNCAGDMKPLQTTDSRIPCCTNNIPSLPESLLSSRFDSPCSP